MSLAGIVGVVYLQHAWQARQVRKQAPPPPPAAVEKQSTGFSFSKVEQNQTLFTVRASRATEYKQDNQSLLEDVQITIYGRKGDRNDSIHTKSCEYRKGSGEIRCTGEVQIDLESAEDARRAGSGGQAARVVHVETRNVSFDRESGQAKTEEAVEIQFPQGKAKAAGLAYESGDGVVQLLKNVELELQRPGAGGTAGQTKVTGTRLEFRRDTRTLRMSGPVHVVEGTRGLTAASLELSLDPEFHAQKLIAPKGETPESRPELHRKDANGEVTLSADEFRAVFNPKGWVERVEAQGGITGKFSGPRGDGQLAASSAALDVSPKTQQPTQLQASGNVFVELRANGKNGGTRQLRTEELLVHFAEASGKRGARIESAETLAPATLEWQGGTNPGKDAGGSTRLAGQRMMAKFTARGQADSLTADGGAEVERKLPGRPTQTTTSRELRASFGAEGDWTEIDLNGDVKMREGERSAQADQAQMQRPSQAALLTGNAVVSDAKTRTTAQKISFVQATGEIRADGQVRSSDLKTGGSGVNLAPQPAHISADHLEANSTTGRALFSGHARLWQGDSVIEADSIELLRDAKQLNANGNVLAVFPQMAAGPGKRDATGKPARASAGTAGPGKGGPSLWRVRAGAMSYWSSEGRAHLQNGVDAKSQQGEITASELDVYFSVGAEGVQAKQMERAVATGGVTVQEQDRRGTADRGEYSATEGKFVLSGGSPTLTDASRGTTTGRQLTFYLADDTIVVDSENGSRTLTKHRVEK